MSSNVRNQQMLAQQEGQDVRNQRQRRWYKQANPLRSIFSVHLIDLVR